MMTIVDFHNHVMPGVDDGASDYEEAAEALKALLGQDVRHVVVTPHVNGSLTLQPAAFSKRLAELDQGWEQLQHIAAKHAPDMEISRGAEVMLDTPALDLSDARIRLAATDFALCEFPYMTVPPNSSGVLSNMLRDGVTPIIAHPERYRGVGTDCRLASQWRRAGALLQINAGSLVGKYGPQARENAHALLERGFVDYLCSDYHARGRPATAAARILLEEAGAHEHFMTLAMVNPARMLAGQAPLPVPPFKFDRSIKARLRQWLR